MKALFFRRIVKLQRTRIKVMVEQNEAKVISVVYDLPDHPHATGAWGTTTQMFDLTFDDEKQKFSDFIAGSQPGTKNEFELALADASKAKLPVRNVRLRPSEALSISNKTLIQIINDYEQSKHSIKPGSKMKRATAG